MPIWLSLRTTQASMLLRAARPPCWAPSGRYIHPAFSVPRSTPWKTAYYRTQLRTFTSSQGPCRNQLPGTTTPEQKEANPNALPVSPITNPKVTATPKDAKNAKVAAAKKDPFLSEATVGAKEQRKADWAIMKEMAKYLWPKVGEFWLWSRDYEELSLTQASYRTHHWWAIASASRR